MVVKYTFYYGYGYFYLVNQFFEVAWCLYKWFNFIVIALKLFVLFCKVGYVLKFFIGYYSFLKYYNFKQLMRPSEVGKIASTGVVIPFWLGIWVWPLSFRKMVFERMARPKFLRGCTVSLLKIFCE